MSTHITRGYLEDTLNTWPLDTPVSESIEGVQFRAVINATQAVGAQFEGTLTQSKAGGAQFEGYMEPTVPGAMQFTGSIEDQSACGTQFNPDLNHYAPIGSQFDAQVVALTASGFQFVGTVEEKKASGVQFEGSLTHSGPVGSQFEGHVFDYRGALGINFMHNYVFHQADSSYLIDEYLVGSYLVSQIKARMAWQFEAKIVDTEKSAGVQFEGSVLSDAQGAAQFEGFIEASDSFGAQFEGQIRDFLKGSGAQFEGVIASRKNNGVQFEGHIEDFVKSFGSQFTAYVVQAMGSQFRAALYNTDNLRILCNFASRGVNPNNWVASSTAGADFSASNLNTDIVEQVWRGTTGDKVGVTLTCDTGVPQGTFLDTLGILNHNLTTSANVELVGANAPDFSGSVSITKLNMTQENSYWIAPTLPLEGYRYWRITISDPTNIHPYLQIGTIVFGEAVILQGENYSNPIRYKRTHYSDKVDTEGFTASQNDRGIKRSLSLDFQSINFNGGNYRNLSNIFESSRTNLKCLWIPTPQYPSRYAVFAKLSQLPDESHIDNGEGADYVDLSIELDEAR